MLCPLPKYEPSKTPAFSAVAYETLASGVGFDFAIFGIPSHHGVLVVLVVLVKCEVHHFGVQFSIFWGWLSNILLRDFIWLVVWLPSILFSHLYIYILGISSSQLTNSNLFQRGFSPTTNQSSSFRHLFSDIEKSSWLWLEISVGADGFPKSPLVFWEDLGKQRFGKPKTAGFFLTKKQTESNGWFYHFPAKGDRIFQIFQQVIRGPILAEKKVRKVARYLHKRDSYYNRPSGCGAPAFVHRGCSCSLLIDVSTPSPLGGSASVNPLEKSWRHKNPGICMR